MKGQHSLCCDGWMLGMLAEVVWKKKSDAKKKGFKKGREGMWCISECKRTRPRQNLSFVQSRVKGNSGQLESR